MMKWRRKLKLTRIKVSADDSPSCSTGHDGTTLASGEPVMKCKGKKNKQKRSFPFTLLSLGSSAGMSATTASSSKVSHDNDESNLPRISMKLTMAELIEEAVARGIQKHYLPTTKAELLNFLVDGSIHLRMTSTWKHVELLRRKMEADCRRIEEAKRLNDESTMQTTEVSQPSQPDNCLPYHFSNRDNSLLDNTAASTFMDSVIDSRFSLPPQYNRSELIRRHLQVNASSDGEDSLAGGAWGCGTPFACTPTEFFCKETEKGNEDEDDHKDKEEEDDDEEDHDDDGRTRDDEDETRLTGITSAQSGSLISVDQTDFDQTEFDQTEFEPPSTIAPRSQLENNSNNKMFVWESSLFFKDPILTPSPKTNLIPKGSSMKGFTVWASLCQHGQIFPTKHFDTTYLALGDANDRARYLFYWKNPWNLPPEKMVEKVCIMADNSARDDCPNTFHCAHPNGEKWSVSVVYDSTFKYLDNASMDRREFYLEKNNKNNKGEKDDTNCRL